MRVGHPVCITQNYEKLSQVFLFLYISKLSWENKIIKYHGLEYFLYFTSNRNKA